jgi:hypothetical protein
MTAYVGFTLTFIMVLALCPCVNCLGKLHGLCRKQIYRHVRLNGQATEHALREAEIGRAAAAAAQSGQPNDTGSAEHRSADDDFPLESNEYVLPAPSGSVRGDDDEEGQDEEPGLDEEEDPFYEDVRETARSFADGVNYSLLRMHTLP